MRKAAKKPGTGSLSARKALPVPSVFSPPLDFKKHHGHETLKPRPLFFM
jgi:hypothetical protein